MATVRMVAANQIPAASSTWMSERSKGTPLDRILSAMPVEFREEPCRSALNRVQGMPFKWSLNPYMGCAHRCTFCYVRGFERRADRPDRKSTRLNSSHLGISYAVFCLKKKSNI